MRAYKPANTRMLRDAPMHPNMHANTANLQVEHTFTYANTQMYVHANHAHAHPQVHAYPQTHTHAVG